jgi:hypothetical protein
MRDALDPQVEAELGGLGEADRVLVRPVLEWLLGGHGLDRLHQTGLQQFLWYELPFKWLGPVADRHHVAAGLGRYFDQCGLSRYAELCRSDQTATILERWAEDPTAGFDAFHAAHVASGVVPPDTPDLQWGALMGPVEVDAFWSTAQALELAVAAELLTPGGARWRQAQAAFTVEHLNRSRPDRFGESWREAVAAERLSAWLDDERGDGQGARSALLLPIANRLLRVPPIPRTAGRVVRPLLWLTFNAAERPIALTPGGALPGRIVRAACDELGWEARTPRHREADVGPLVEVRAAAERIGLVQVRGSRLWATARGRDIVDAPRRHQTRRVWARLVRDQASRTGIAGELEELLDAVLLDVGREAAGSDLADLVRVPLTERGWLRGAPGRPVPDGLLQPTLQGAIDRRAGLGLVVTRQGQARDPLRLTEAGRAFAIAGLRARATRPRRA